MIFVGADVHVRNSYLYATNFEGKRLIHGRVPNSLAELCGFCEELMREVGGEVQPVRFVLESTTNSRPVQRLLRQAATGVGFEEVTADVLNARKLRIIAESVSKCDAIDGRVLNQLARSNLTLPTCYMSDDEEFALREHLRARSDLVRMRTMIKNRIHSVLHRRGILTPKEGLFSKDGRKFLDELALDDAGRTIATQYLTALDQFETLIDQSDKDLRQVMRRPRWAKPAALLQTMPGIGVITALTILAELGDLKRFRSRAAVANYAGLVPVIRDSNTKHYSGGITHCGSAHLRAVLSEAAWTAVKRVPLYEALFERVAGRRGKQIAIVAVARRMLEDAVRMLWKQEAFRFVPVTSDVAKAASNAVGTPCSDPSIRAAKAAKVEVAASVAG
jgi:transposase